MVISAASGLAIDVECYGVRCVAIDYGYILPLNTVKNRGIRTDEITPIYQMCNAAATFPDIKRKTGVGVAFINDPSESIGIEIPFIAVLIGSFDSKLFFHFSNLFFRQGLIQSVHTYLTRHTSFPNKFGYLVSIRIKAKTFYVDLISQ